jgi:hypothetical protein
VPKRPAAPKRPSSAGRSSRRIPFLLSGIMLFVGLIAGYAVGNVLPVTKVNQLAGDGMSPAEAQRRIAELQEKLQELNSERDETEVELGETQIQAILKNS